MTDAMTLVPWALVVGASGKTGRRVVDELLARGRHVRAFARHASALAPRECLERIDADVLDEASVTAAMRGVTHVISTLGPSQSSPVDLCARGTRNVIAAMRAHGATRLVCVTGAMIGLPHERLGLVYRFIESHVPAETLADRRLQEELVQKSELDWTLIRPTRLTDGAATGALRPEELVVGALAHVSRADVARFAVDALDMPERIGSAFTLAAA
jgi:putative NADH-flavin reductase